MSTTSTVSREATKARQPDAASLTLQGVGKHFVEGGHWAVRDLDIAVQPGEFFGLLGPSGCGKTTTLNMIAGFLRPDEGAVLVNGEDMSRVPPHRRGISMVFQDYALFPHMSAKDNVEFGMKVQGIPTADRNAKSSRLLDLVDLSARTDHMPAQLSGGQQQRVAVARALSIDPDIVLLDEPLSNLDTRLRNEVRDELATMFREAGVTVILVTHDQGEAFAFCDRVAVLLAGKLQTVAPPTELYSRPPSRTVAEFLGAANFLPAELLHDEAGSDGRASARIRLGEGDLTCRVSVSDQVGKHATPGQVLVRPEALLLSSSADEPVAGVEHVAPATVTSAEFLGDMTIYQVRISAGPTLRVKSLFSGLLHDIGSDVHVWWRPEAVHYVPAGAAA